MTSLTNIKVKKYKSPKNRNNPTKKLYNEFIKSGPTINLKIEKKQSKSSGNKLTNVSNKDTNNKKVNIDLIPNELGQNLDLEKWSLTKVILLVKKIKDVDINIIEGLKFLLRHYAKVA